MTCIECLNGWHNNAESLINFAPGVVPLQEQIEPYTQYYLEPNILTSLLGEQTITPAGNIQEALTGFTIGDVYALAYFVKEVDAGAQLVEDITSIFGGSTLVYTEGRQYIVEIVANTTKLQLNNPGTADIVLEDIQLRKRSAHHKNLVTNGGLPYGTDWIDSNADGLADGWQSTSGGVPVIVQGNGFDGNAQRVDDDGVNASYVGFPNTIVSGKTYKISLKYRTNYTFSRIYFNGFLQTAATVAVNTGDAIYYEVEVLATETGDIRFGLNQGAGRYIEVDEIRVTDITDPGFDIYRYRPFQDWPANTVLPDVGIGNYTAKRELSPVEKEMFYKISKIGVDLS